MADINNILANGMQPIDVIGNYQAGQRNALAMRANAFELQQAQDQAQRQNLLRQAMPGALRGDQNAFDAVAQNDPATAVQLQTQRRADSTKAHDALLQAALAMKTLPPEQVPNVWAHVVPQMKRQFPGVLDEVPDQYDPDTWQQFQASSGLASLTPEQASQALQQSMGVKADKPSAIQEYEYAKKQGYKGTLADWNKEQKTAVQQFKVDNPVAPQTGTPPGYRVKPDGTMEAIPGGPADPANPLNQKKVTEPSKYSPKEQQAARDKLRLLGVAKVQLQTVKDQFAKIKDSLAAGPGAAIVMPLSESGNNFDAAVDQMRETISGLTRVPGVGAMSDYETRLSQSKLPSRNEYESSAAQKIQGLEQFIKNLESGYQDIAGTDGSADATPPPPAAPKTVTRTGTLPDGRKVIQYSDGSTEVH